MLTTEINDVGGENPNENIKKGKKQITPSCGMAMKLGWHFKVHKSFK